MWAASFCFCVLKPNAEPVGAIAPPGRLVDVGGFRLHMHCSGEGSPAIVLDAALGGSSLSWSLVQPELAKVTRACSYDRAGFGWTDAGPMPRTAGSAADELRTLLERAGVPPPHVLVGHLFGCFATSMANPSYLIVVDQKPPFVCALVPEYIGILQQAHAIGAWTQQLQVPYLPTDPFPSALSQVETSSVDLPRIFRLLSNSYSEALQVLDCVCEPHEAQHLRPAN